jgi:uncharacterized transporter YbjL
MSTIILVEEKSEKQCIKCNETKDSQFYNNKYRPNICTVCLKLDAKEKYLKNKDKKDKLSPEQKQQDKDKIKHKKIKLSPEEKEAREQKANIKEQEIEEQDISITLQKRSMQNNEIYETTDYMISKIKRDKILKLLIGN